MDKKILYIVNDIAPSYAPNQIRNMSFISLLSTLYTSIEEDDTTSPADYLIIVLQKEHKTIIEEDIEEQLNIIYIAINDAGILYESPIAYLLNYINREKNGLLQEYEYVFYMNSMDSFLKTADENEILNMLTVLNNNPNINMVAQSTYYLETFFDGALFRSDYFKEIIPTVFNKYIFDIASVPLTREYLLNEINEGRIFDYSNDNQKQVFYNYVGYKWTSLLNFYINEIQPIIDNNDIAIFETKYIQILSDYLSGSLDLYGEILKKNQNIEDTMNIIVKKYCSSGNFKITFVA